MNAMANLAEMPPFARGLEAQDPDQTSFSTLAARCCHQCRCSVASAKVPRSHRLANAEEVRHSPTVGH